MSIEQEIVSGSPAPNAPSPSTYESTQHNHVYVDVAQMSNPVISQHSAEGNAISLAWQQQSCHNEDHLMNELRGNENSQQQHLMTPSRL